MIAISAGNHAQAVAYAAAEEGVDALRRDVAGRLRAEDRRDARLRRDGRPRGDGPGRGVRAARAAASPRRGRDARAPVRRPGRDRGRRHGRARDRGGRARRRRRHRRGRRRRADRRHRRRARRPAHARRRRRARDEPAPARRRSRPGSPSRSSRARSPTASTRPFAGTLPIELCRDLERVLVTEDGDRGRVPLPLRAREARVRAGRRRGRAAALLTGKVQAERPVVDRQRRQRGSAQTASAILARP